MTMRRLFFLAGIGLAANITATVLTTAVLQAHALVTMANMQTPEPPKFPEGQMCSPKGDVVWKNGRLETVNKHECKCHRVDHDEQCEGIPIEDKVCRQYCNAKACSCPIDCSVPGHHMEGQ